MKFSASSVFFHVIDTISGKIVAFGCSSLSDVINSTEIKNPHSVLNFLKDKDSGRFGKITVVYDNPVFTMIPDELFSEKDAKKYLSAAHAFQPNEIAGYDRLKTLEMNFIYWIPSDLAEFSGKYFLVYDEIHLSSCFTKFCAVKNIQSNSVYLYISSDLIYFQAFKNGKLVLCNAYNCMANEDVLFYSLNVYQQLGFDRKNVSLILSGETIDLPEMKNVLADYFHDVRYFLRPENYTYCKGIADLPEFMYSLLFHSAL